MIIIILIIIIIILIPAHIPQSLHPLPLLPVSQVMTASDLSNRC